jgi:hypothetical protein
MGKLFGFLKKDGKKKNRNESSSASMWEMMQKMSQDFKEQEKQLKEQSERIEEKRRVAEARGIVLDTSHINRSIPEPVDYSGDEPSMWDMLRKMENKFAEENRYLNQLEKAYDEALAKETVVEKKVVVTKKEI